MIANIVIGVTIAAGVLLVALFLLASLACWAIGVLEANEEERLHANRL